MVHFWEVVDISPSPASNLHYIYVQCRLPG